MKIKEYDKVRLTDGRVVRIVDMTKPGIAYLAEIPTPEGPGKYEDFFIEHEEIAEVLEDDYPMVNPYE